MSNQYTRTSLCVEKIKNYANFGDYHHCFQCCLRSILEYFEPTTEWTWEQLDSLTYHLPNMATWERKTAIEMVKRDYDVRYYVSFDYGFFADDPKACLEKFFSPERLQWSLRLMDVRAEAGFSRQMLSYIEDKKIDHIARPATLEDIKELLSEGFLVNQWVNSFKLYGREGMLGHAVLLVDMTEDSFVFHDPGDGNAAKPKAFVKMPFEDFWPATQDNGETGGTYAFRKRADR